MESLHQRQEGQVEKQHLVFGVVGNPGHQVRVQARVQGVQHAAGTADAEIQLQVPVAVPGQRGNAVTELQLQHIQRLGHLARAARHIAVGVTVNVTLHPARDNFSVTVVALRKIDQR
jgi:hypothetical protein